MTALTRREALTWALLAGSTAVLSGCVPAAAPPLVLGCGEAGGSYLQFGELLADATSSSTRLRISPLPTEGSVDNLALLAARRVDLALSLVDSAVAADSAADVVAIGRVYQNYLQCVVRADGGIRSLDDLAGRTVSLGAPGSGAAATARRVLEVSGLAGSATPPRVVERTFRDAVDDLEAGSIDALFWSGGVPTPQIADLATRVPIAVIDTTPALDGLARAYPEVYAATTIPAGVYDAPRAVPTIGVANLLLARSDLADDLVRALVDALIDDAPALVPADALGIQYLTPASLIDTAPLALHPSAERRYRERYG
ncbi:TRAP transporter TAXI family solute receptor [Microbacterium testaceum]|uniref:TAXI family TRAP transporter solute-binding subunit n=1 Tax=Microbacterium testaceum TaxID=2033 RepID=UPI00278532C7|nr:TAXI family TRAP transporter solute-binding subunit [Microbacterium testaceum]MDQ1173939.1 TRAP transporter TAXI family solute receptor [Microbacterium testaceum]